MTNKPDPKPFGPFRHFKDIKRLHSFDPPVNLSEMGDGVIFVLDSNILLNLYDYKNKSINNIHKIYKILSAQKRIFVSGHSIREFYMKKSEKLKNALSDWKEMVVDFQNPASKTIDLLKEEPEVKEQIELEQQIRKLSLRIKELNKIIKTKSSEIRWNDRIVTIYREIFTDDNIIELDVMSAEFQNKIQNRVESALTFTTGKDAGKDLNAYGDLLIWYSILHLASVKQRNIVFVTEDKKAADWYSDKVSEKTNLAIQYEFAELYPKLKFMSCDFTEFLKYSDADQSTIKDVIEVAKSNSHEPIYKYESGEYILDLEHSESPVTTNIINYLHANEGTPKVILINYGNSFILTDKFKGGTVTVKLVMMEVVKEYYRSDNIFRFKDAVYSIDKFLDYVALRPEEKTVFVFWSKDTYIHEDIEAYLYAGELFLVPDISIYSMLVGHTTSIIKATKIK